MSITLARMGRSVSALLVLALISSFSISAQDATGNVIGVVSDPTGAVIPKAKITVTNVETKISSVAYSGGDGSYQVPLLPIGVYQVTAEATGFRKEVVSQQQLQINQSLKIDLRLQVGASTDVVQVEANASGVETVSAAVGNSVTGEQIQNLPLNGRNVMGLALLQPGVVPNSSGQGFSIAGGRPDSITYLLDGGVNNDLLSNALVVNPNPDMIEEFKVIESTYSAEYGRNAGGIVSVVTKSGGNAFHGALYDYVRNNDFNANTFFNNEQGLARNVLKRNQFGAAISGPIWIPKVFNGRNKLFFTMSYQGQRLSQLSTSSKIITFTPAEATGDFSHSNATGTGPDSKVVSFLQKYPYYQPSASLAAQGIISPSAINPVAQAYLKANLVPITPSGSLFYQAAATNNADELTERIDYNLTEKDHLSVTLGSSRNPQLTPGNPGYPYVNTQNRYSGTATYTKTITPSMINEFRFTAQRNNGVQDVPAATLPKPNALGVNINSDDPTGPPLLSFASGMTTGFNANGPTSLVDNTYVWSDALTFIRGRHSFKTGFSYTPFQDNTAYDFYVNGEFYFYGTGSGSFSQNDHADFLMGLPDEFFQSPRAPSNIRTYQLSGYFQDEWKLRKNLTLSLGIRYEYSSPKQDTQGRSFSLGIGQQSTVFPNAPLGLLFPGDPQAPRGANFADKNDWAPRFGFAWDPKGDGKMSIRGGFGIFYDILKGEDNLQFNGQEPFFGTADLFSNPLTANPTGPSNLMTNPYAAAGVIDPFPSQPPPKNLNFKIADPTIGNGGVYFVDPHLRTPYVYQYNFSIDREIMRNTTLKIAYVGSDSHKLTGLKDANPYILGTNTRLFNKQPGVAAGTFGYLEEFGNVGQANYNSIQIGLTRRYSGSKLGDLQYQVSYNHSRSIDNESGFRATNGIVPAYNFDQFKSVSDFNVPNYFALSGTWGLPFDKLWESGPKRLTKGWNLYPIISYQSGTPLDIRARLTTSPTKPGPSGVGDSSLVRANLVAPIVDYSPETLQTIAGKTGNYYFNPADFSTAGLSTINALTNPASATYGTLGRNAFTGPHIINANIAIGKSIAIYGDRAKVEIRGEFFNVLNHAEFSNPSTSITSSAFGQVSATGDPRIIQLAARFVF
jgi:outer membrane receptor protein involved in Fe transport